MTIWLLPLPVSFVKPIPNAANVDFLKDGSHSEPVFDVTVVISLIIAPIAAIVIVNVMITKAIKKQRGKVDCERRRGPTGVAQAGNRGKTISCLIVVLIFLVSWFPRSLLNFLYLSKIHHIEGLKLLEKISLVFLFFQSSINPLLYSFYRRDFRLAAKSLFKRMIPFKRRTSWVIRVENASVTTRMQVHNLRPANCQLTEIN